ncbi:MAG: carbohydrate kinase family protein [Anaerolineales bacterium]|jgi:pseudouridine kinase|nr:carbohydrate kinase family protein [Anaerolineales bacterium]
MQKPPEEQTVLVLGAAGVDIVARITGEIQMETSNPARIRTSFGGAARNVAENLARLGQPVSLLTVTGSDPAGQEMLAYTRQAGVDVSHVHLVEKYPTGSYMAFLNEKGHLQYAFDDMRVLAELSASYLTYHQDLFESASLLFLDANLPPPTLKTAFALAARYNLPVCADPTSRLLALRLQPYLKQLRLIVPSAAEAAILTGQSFEAANTSATQQAARALVNLGADIAVITMSEFGLCYATSETSGHIPAVHTTINDPTGAGDALTAAIIYALLNDIEIDDAARLGAAAAALALQYSGTVYPDLSLDKLYDQFAT